MRIISAKVFMLVVAVMLLSIFLWVTLERGPELIGQHTPHEETGGSIDLEQHMQPVVSQRLASAVASLAVALLTVLSVALIPGLLVPLKVGRECADTIAEALLHDPFLQALRRGRIQPQDYNGITK